MKDLFILVKNSEWLSNGDLKSGLMHPDSVSKNWFKERSRYWNFFAIWAPEY